MPSGTLFHSSGVETAKALEPYDLRLKSTGLRRNAEDDQSVLNNCVSGLEYR